jgi:putative CocE/NonD family hydrolase
VLAISANNINSSGHEANGHIGHDYLSNDPGSTSATAKLAPYFLDWLDHPLYDSYWNQWSIEENFANIQVPALTVAAWYDIFQGGSLRNYLGLKAHGGNEAARMGQRLLVTIGGHAGGGRKIGALDFGPAATEFNEETLILEWHDYLFLGKQNEFATEKPVKIFVMGENKWRYEDTWPLERAKQTIYFLHSAGRANSASGDGSLSTVANQTEAAHSYIYSPANPVPTVGGPLCCDSAHLAAGPQDQREVENRPDVFGLLHASSRPRHGGHRAGIARPLCQILGGGHGLHRQTG